MAKPVAGHRGNSTRTIVVSLAISLAGFLYGIDTGIIASTIAQKTFKTYMYGSSAEDASVRAGIVSGYYAGYVFGSGGSAYTMDKLSRRWSLLLGSCASVLGAILQTAAQNPAMMIVGRAFSGFSTGMVYPTAPVYLAELSPPENRGFLVGLKGLMNTLGFFAAGWIGYAGSFAVVAMKERYDEAKAVMYSLQAHRGSEVIEAEFAEMCSQIRLEANKKKKSRYTTLFTRQYLRRNLLACLIVNMTKLSGSNIIQNYQSVMYNSLGYEGRTVLLIGGLYGFMAIIGQVINVFFVADHWTRRTTVVTGNYMLALLLAILAALSKYYGEGSDNPAGARAGVAFIFMFSFAYSFYFNSVNWVLVAEIFPLDLRGAGVGFAVFTQSITAIWLSFAASIAFDSIAWKFYFVFIACNVFAGTIYYFFLPETRLLSLEEVAAKFGDEVVVPPTAKELGLETSAQSPADPDKIDISPDHVEVSRK
ncbi:putative arabinose efflux permease, MFS family [Geosmithia morbida]|uniref:Arabinose efflux permease, MFS family n=1 Tax=Geosmithia morbida TaxID=1094350 RepID=A0A9P4YZE7_9HYPO|nr:putative arabinose efflux permease, MFS family [Geosmithia morbida]KAF4125352.1 putative arabinose efflux permease, MFS family [Geosmithia morbida]